MSVETNEEVAARENRPSTEMNLTVSVSFGDIRAEFTGSPEAVLSSVNSFLAKEIPEFSLARKLYLNFSVKELVENFQQHIRITPEGARVWNSAEKKYSDKELIALQLVAQRIASDTSGGVPSLTLASLQESTSLNPKSLSSRLSELAKVGLVIRENAEDGTRFRITTQGIDWLSGILAKKA